MQQVEEAIFLLGTGLCLLSACTVALRTKQLELDRSNFYLCFVLLILGHYGMSHFAVEYTATPTMTVLVFGVGASTWYLLGPFTWFYVRSYTGHGSELRLSDLWHFVPFILQTVNLLPYAFLGVPDKLEIIDDLMTADTLHGTSPLGSYFPDAVHVILRPLIALSYASYALFHIYKLRKRDFGQPTGPLDWPILFTALQASLCVFYLVVLMVENIAGMPLQMVLNSQHMQWVIGLEYTLLGVAVYFHSHVIYAKPAPNPSGGDLEQPVLELITESVGINPSDFGNMKYDKEQLEKVGSQILEYFAETSAHLDPNFDLHKLSKDTGVAVSKLSAYFKDYRGQKFNDFKIEMRIRHAESMIERGEASGYKIEAIAQSCGYVSRTTFIEHFKKVTGKNPSEYIKERNDRRK